MDVDLFRKVLGLLGSDQAGERSAAAMKATQLLKESDASWADVSIKGTDASGPDALNKALGEVQTLKSALAEAAVRNRVLLGQIEALKSVIAGAEIQAENGHKRERDREPKWWQR